MQCNIVLESPDHIQLSLIGALDAKGVGLIESEFKSIVCSSHKHILVDLSQITFLASIGLRMLLQAAKHLTQDHHFLALYSPPPRVREVLHVAAMDRLMPVVQDQESACRLLQD